MWLNKLRTGQGILPDGSVIKLHMMATMGNAFCFPLQTAVFACVVKAAYRALGLPFSGRRDYAAYVKGCGEKDPYLVRVMGDRGWGVFGDDIVVEEEAYPLVSRLLSYLVLFRIPIKPFTEDMSLLGNPVEPIIFKVPTLEVCIAKPSDACRTSTPLSTLSPCGRPNII